MGQDYSGTPRHWRDWINEGMQAYNNAHYEQAIAAFQTAADLNLSSPVPHLYIALGWEQLYVQDDPSPDNVERARWAEAALRRALEIEPNNWNIFVRLGMLARTQDRLEDARILYRRALAVQPWNANTWCTVAVIDFYQWLRRGKPLDGFVELIRAFEKSIDLDPAHETAMGYLALLFHERALMSGNDEERRNDLLSASTWLDRAADVRSERVQTSIAQPPAHPLQTNDPDAYLNFVASMAVTPAPPPPLPPPPPPWGVPARTTSGPVIFERVVEGAPRPIRVPPAVQAQKLIAKIDPQVPWAGESENPLRFVVVIGKDGRIVKSTFIEGNVWLQQAAVDALRKWVYRPTLIEGTPVEVVTEVRVSFLIVEGAPRPDSCST